MITTIFDQVSRLLGQAYVVSSLTPWLMFWVANVVTIACLLGPRSLHRWWMAEIDTSVPILAVFTVVAVVFLAASALLMNAAYALFRRTLEGDTNIPAIRLLVLASAAFRRRQNAQLLQEFATVRQQYGSCKVFAVIERAHVSAAIQKAQETNLPAATPSEIAAFDELFNAAMSTDDERQAITEGRIAFEQTLSTVSSDAFTLYLERWNGRIENLVDASALRAADVATRAADVSAVAAAPSSYGDALASVSRYASSRYGIDSIVFWSRLQPLIQAEYLAVVEGAKVRMDMLTALTVLSLLYAMSWFFLLPYFAVEPRVLLAICGSGVAAAALFYVGSVEAARSFAETVRSSFDLYRHDLLKKLGFTVPATLEHEKETWSRISRFVLYRDPVDLPFAPRSGDDTRPNTEPDAPATTGFLAMLWATLAGLWITPTPEEPAAGPAPPSLPTLPTIPVPPRSRAAQIRTLARAAVDAVVIVGLVYLGRWQLPRLQTPRAEHVVLAPVATVHLPPSARVKARELAFRIGTSARPDDLVLDVAEIVDRQVSRQIEAGAFVRRGDLHEGRSVKLIKLEVSAVGQLAASARVDLWRATSTSGEEFHRVLAGVEIASAEGTSPGAPVGQGAATAASAAQTGGRPVATLGATQQTPARVATNTKADAQGNATKRWTVYVKVPADWTPTSNDPSRPLFAVPVATAAEETAATAEQTS